MPAGEGKIANLFYSVGPAGPAQYKRKESRNFKGLNVGDSKYICPLVGIIYFSEASSFCYLEKCSLAACSQTIGCFALHWPLERPKFLAGWLLF
jgi:hypothetical protein